MGKYSSDIMLFWSKNENLRIEKKKKQKQNNYCQANENLFWKTGCQDYLNTWKSMEKNNTFF